MEFNERQLALDVAALSRMLADASVVTNKLAMAILRDERAQASLLKRELVALGASMRANAAKLDRACSAP